MKVSILCFLVAALGVESLTVREPPKDATHPKDATPSKDVKLLAKSNHTKEISDKSNHTKEISDKFKSSIQKIIKQQWYTTRKPIVVTAFDQWYNDIAPKWVARNKELRVDQFIMLVMDEASAKLAKDNGFPAITATGELAGEKGVSFAKAPWTIPSKLSSVKFLLPSLLMEEGFEDVIFSEMDVFFFQNPFTATKDIRGHFLCIDDTWKPDYSEQSGKINIGFMEFRPKETEDQGNGQMVGMLKTFATNMENENPTEVARDQAEFNDYIHQHDWFKPIYLDPNWFAAKGSHRTDKTQIVHMAWASPNCKKQRLLQLYDNPKSPVSEMASPSPPEDWMEC